MMRARILALGGVLVVLTALAASAQAPQIRAESDRDKIQLGDRVKLVVSVTHDPGLRVDWPDAPSLEPFELLDQVVDEPRRAGEQVESQSRYTLTSFELGRFELPRIEVVLRDKDGERIHALETRPIVISVESVGIDEGEEIRDIHGPLSMPDDGSGIVGRLLWIVLLASAAYAFFRIRRTARLRTDETPRTRRLLPHDAAYQALDRLEASDLITQGAIKEYYIAATGILRTYIAARFEIDALEMASREILESLDAVGLDVEARSGFAILFREGDLVKFAKHDPGIDASRALVPAMRRLVDETRQDSGPEEADDGDKGSRA